MNLDFFAFGNENDDEDEEEEEEEVTIPETMQEMTSRACAALLDVDEVSDFELVDTRNEGRKSYKIVKLRDGNCWMASNLDLDLVEGEALTPADTDIKEDFIPNKSTSNEIETWDYNNVGEEALENFSIIPRNTYSFDPEGAGLGEHIDGNFYNIFSATAGTVIKTNAASSQTPTIAQSVQKVGKLMT